MRSGAGSGSGEDPACAAAASFELNPPGEFQFGEDLLDQLGADAAGLGDDVVEGEFAGLVSFDSSMMRSRLT